MTFTFSKVCKVHFLTEFSADHDMFRKFVTIVQSGNRTTAASINDNNNIQI